MAGTERHDAAGITGEWGAILGHGDERYRIAFGLAPIGMAILDRHGTILELNDAWGSIVGYHRDELIGTLATALLMQSADDTIAVESIAESQLESSHDGTIILEVLLSRADGTPVWVHTESTVVDDDGGKHDCVVNMLVDITERKRFESELHFAATHDPLTNIANGAVFRDALHRALARRDLAPETVAVLFADLDEFKHVNDTRGHDFGDELLTRVADRFREALREGDLVARYGGDEFVILAEAVGSPGDAMALANRIVSSIAEPFDVRDDTVSIGVSIGVALNRVGAEDLLVDADAAMYEAKMAGGHRAVLYTSPGPPAGPFC